MIVSSITFSRKCCFLSWVTAFLHDVRLQMCVKCPLHYRSMYLLAQELHSNFGTDSLNGRRRQRCFFFPGKEMKSFLPVPRNKWMKIPVPCRWSHYCSSPAILCQWVTAREAPWLKPGRWCVWSAPSTRHPLTFSSSPRLLESREVRLVKMSP